MSDEAIRLCLDCLHEVEEVHAGDEGWSVCSGCRNIEQGSFEVSVEQYEAVQDLTEKEQWAFYKAQGCLPEKRRA